MGYQRKFGSWEWVDLPVHMTDIYVKVKDIPKRMRLSVYRFQGKFYVCEPKMGYVIPMYKGPLEVAENEMINITQKTIGVLKERARLGLENRIAERGLERVLSALGDPKPQIQFLEV